MTKPELRRRALGESGAVVSFIEERRAKRPENDPIIRHHELSDRRVTLHDEETTRIYVKEQLPGVKEMRDQFVGRGIHNAALDRLHESPQNEADLRTIATALEEMAGRLR